MAEKKYLVGRTEDEGAREERNPILGATVLRTGLQHRRKCSSEPIARL
jgi:hypothetical protein